MTTPTVCVTHAKLPAQCPVCREHIASGPVVSRCPKCDTPQHAECLTELGCASLGCKPGGTVPGTRNASQLDTDDEAREVLCYVERDGMDEYPIHNPSGLDLGDYTRGTGGPQIIWVGAAFMTPYRFLSTGDISSTLDDIGTWLQEHAPGLLTEPEYPDDANGEGQCPECIETDHIPCRHVEEAEQDLTSLDGGLWIASEEWGCYAPSEEESHAIRVALFERAVIERIETDIITALENVREDARNCGGILCDESHHEAPEIDHEDACPIGGYIDVRLQARPGPWSVSVNVHSGNSSYDQDHRGFWGSSCIAGHETDDDLVALADSLIDDCVEAYAEHVASGGQD